MTKIAVGRFTGGGVSMEATKEASRPGFSRIFFGSKYEQTLLRLVIATVLLAGMFRVSLMPIKVVGISMLPTYEDGAISFVNKLSYLRQQPGRGDVVAVESHEPRTFYLKRIVAMPGERMSVRQGRIVIDGKLLEEPYAPPNIPWQYPGRTLAEDQYFVIGDNRKLSSFGFVRKEEIVGKVIF